MGYSEDKYSEVSDRHTTFGNSIILHLTLNDTGVYACYGFNYGLTRSFANYASVQVAGI